MIKERIKQLQDLMKQHDIDLYIIPTSDDHQSEYVGEYFKCRQFMSGFTGSAGTMVVTHDEAYLWVDGRYFIQAENEIKDTTHIKTGDYQPIIIFMILFLFSAITLIYWSIKKKN